MRSINQRFTYLLTY